MPSDFDFLSREKRKVYRELYRQYIDEGYSPKLAKRYAATEAEEFMLQNESFLNEILDASFEDKD
jgi:hypothetical protein